jgi:hypothetical protein
MLTPKYIHNDIIGKANKANIIPYLGGSLVFVKTIIIKLRIREKGFIYIIIKLRFSSKFLSSKMFKKLRINLILKLKQIME